MTWAKDDTEALRSIDLLALAEDPSVVVYLRRAADEIERLQARVAERELRTQRFDGLREADAAEVMRLEARVAELEAAVAFQQERVRDEARAKVAGWLHAIPRATLVSALRERAETWDKQAQSAAASDARTLFSECAARRAECVAMALVIERGEWPKGPGDV